MKKNLTYIHIISLCCIMFTVNGCKKFIEVDPPVTNVNEGNVYSSDGTAISAVLGIYTNLAQGRFHGILTYYPELYADNLRMLNLTNATQVPYYRNELTPSGSGDDPQAWMILYQTIYSTNAAIEGLSKTTTLTEAVRKHLLGQALFLRGYFYFYLVNLYGDVPLALTSEYNINTELSRSPIDIVYKQIIKDLTQATSLLSPDYLTGNMITSFPEGQEKRVTANQSAAYALLARVYLYQKDWLNAQTASDKVINASQLYSINIGLNDVFLIDSKETILGLQNVYTFGNSIEADFYVLRDDEPTEFSTRSHYFSNDFLNSFETGDQRKSAWVGIKSIDNNNYFYPAKFKALPFTDQTEQSMLLRLGEQYLIRAEAQIQLGNITEGINDLNALRNRATDKDEQDPNNKLKQLPTSMSKAEALVAVEHERRVELFAEGAHRFFDLKRTGRVDAVMSTASREKGGEWQPYKTIFPIPSEELLNNINLKQNTGY